MEKKTINYKELYSFIKEGVSIKDLKEMFGVCDATISYCRSIGNALLDGNAPAAPTLASFTPRQLMEELAARGYKGSLSYTKMIDICKL